MKHLARLLSLLILVSTGIFFANCDGDGGEGKSAEEKQLDKLKGNWTLTSVIWSEDGSDDRFDASEVVLNITGNFEENGTYSFDLSADPQVDASPWPESVDWEFGADYNSDIIRLDSDVASGDIDVPMTYTLSGDQLKFEFEYGGTGFVVNGRALSTGGTWTFEFTRQ